MGVGLWIMTQFVRLLCIKCAKNKYSILKCPSPLPNTYILTKLDLTYFGKHYRAHKTVRDVLHEPQHQKQKSSQNTKQFKKR